MLKYLLTVEAAFHLKQRGIVLVPSLTADFFDQLKEQSFTGVLVFADGRRQAVKGYFALTHFFRTQPGLPAWETECVLDEGSGAVPAGTELWWNAPE